MAGSDDTAMRGLRAVHHIGATVADMDRSLAFWEPFLGVRARWRTILDARYVGRHVGYPGIRIDASFLDLPGGVVLELLQYLDRDDPPHDDATARPGNVHLCLLVDDIDAQWARAVALGARPVASAPVDITSGPNAGARVAYLRDPDGITLELYRLPPAASGRA
jgi:catechol 2,3-dioxygenase-like lactoylglutathione lyase family enzyme